jgi:hypothetical protein
VSAQYKEENGSPRKEREPLSLANFNAEPETKTNNDESLK